MRADRPRQRQTKTLDRPRDLLDRHTGGPRDRQAKAWTLVSQDKDRPRHKWAKRQTYRPRHKWAKRQAYRPRHNVPRDRPMPKNNV